MKHAGMLRDLHAISRAEMIKSKLPAWIINSTPHMQLLFGLMHAEDEDCPLIISEAQTLLVSDLNVSSLKAAENIVSALRASKYVTETTSKRNAAAKALTISDTARPMLEDMLHAILTGHLAYLQDKLTQPNLVAAE